MSHTRKVKAKYRVSLKDVGGRDHDFTNLEDAKVFVREKMGGRIAHTYSDEVGVWCYGPSSSHDREVGIEQAAYVIQTLVDGKTYNERQ